MGIVASFYNSGIMGRGVGEVGFFIFVWYGVDGECRIVGFGGLLVRRGVRVC